MAQMELCANFLSTHSCIVKEIFSVCLSACTLYFLGKLEFTCLSLSYIQSEFELE